MYLRRHTCRNVRQALKLVSQHLLIKSDTGTTYSLLIL
jgi:hypothetical protein